MSEIIYCVEILKQKHELLRNDRGYFLGLQQYKKCVFIRDLEKNIEVVVEMLIGECKTQLNDSTTLSEELKASYTTLIGYFDLDFEKKIARLEYQLEEQKKKLKFLPVFFNFRAANKIREEIWQTQKELKFIHEQLRKSNLS